MDETVLGVILQESAENSMTINEISEDNWRAWQTKSLVKIQFREK